MLRTERNQEAWQQANFRPLPPGRHRRQGVSHHRKVEARFDVSKLLQAVSDWLDDVADSLKPIGDFICKHFSIRNLLRLGKDAKHQFDQDILKVRIESAPSRKEKMGLSLRKHKEHVAYEGGKKLDDFKHKTKSFFSKLLD